MSDSAPLGPLGPLYPVPPPFLDAPHLVRGMLHHPRTLEAVEAMAAGGRQTYEDRDIAIVQGHLLIKDLATCDAEQVKVAVTVLPRLRIVVHDDFPDSRRSYVALRRLCTFAPAVVVRTREFEGVFPPRPGERFEWHRVGASVARCN